MRSQLEIAPKIRDCAPPRNRAPEWWYLGVSVLVLLSLWAVFAWISPAGHDVFDYWEHVASIRQLMADPIHPWHPQYATHEPSRQYMPWFLFLALCGRGLNWSPPAVLTLGAMLTTALCLLGVFLFFNEYFENRWAPVAGLVAVFCAWGKPWIWSSFYNLRSLLYTAAYPSTLVFGLTFVIWWLGLRIMKAERLPGWKLAAISVLSGLALLIHQLSGLFAVAGLACLVGAEPPFDWRRKGALFGAVAVGAAAIAYWPYFNPWQMANPKQLWNPQWTSIQAQRFYRPGMVLLCVGPAWLGLVALALFIRRRVHLGVVLGFAGSAAAYLIGGFLHNPISHRVLVLVILYLQIGVAWLLLKIWRDPEFLQNRGVSRPRLRAAAAAAVAGLVLFHVGVAGMQVARIAFPNNPVLSRLPLSPRRELIDDLRRLATHLSHNSVVMATPDPAFILPAFEGRVVSMYRASPLVADDAQRAEASRLFFSRGATLKTRENIIDRYHVTYICYETSDLQDSSVVRSLAELARRRFYAGKSVLLQIQHNSDRGSDARLTARRPLVTGTPRPSQ